MVSLIITTYNERDNIGALLQDLATQTRRPEELVIVDGGSTDGTAAECEKARSALAEVGIELNLRSEPGVNIAEGRNIAIEAARHECICVTDAGCRIDPEWCHNITEPILAGRADLVGGFFRPVHRNSFQRVVGALTVASRPPRNFMPSSRSIAFTRTIWQAAGGYPEWLRWGEDTLFNEYCLAEGARYEIAESAIVRWEVRPTYGALMRQFYRYALGDGMRRRLSTSHLMNLGAVLLPILLAVFWHPSWIVLFPAYVLLIALRASRRIRFRDLPMAIGIVGGMRLARAVGYFRGWLLSPSVARERRNP